MIMLSRLLAITKKEIRQLRRDRLTFGMIVGMPVIQMLLFGFAINTDVRHLDAAVADQANTQYSRQIIAELQQSQVVNIVARSETAAEIENLLRKGSISVGVHIPADVERRVVDGNRAAIHLLIDGSDPTIMRVARQLSELPLATSSGAAARKHTAIEVRPYYNPEQRSPVNIVPGLMATILMMTMTLFTAVAIVRERERGNLELLINTPLNSAELMIGKIAPYILIGLIQLTLVLAIGWLLFEVPVRGSMFDLYLAAMIFIASNLALGLLISTLSNTQFQAMQLFVLVMLPSILLSGFMFPFEGMPRIAQFIGELLPATHFMRLTRGIMLRAASIGELQQEVFALAVFTLLAITAAALRFSKRLD